MDTEILPDGIIEQRIDRLAQLINPMAHDFMMNLDPVLHHPHSPMVLFYSEKKKEAIKAARKIVAAGWCPGPIGEKAILDNYFKV